MRGLKTDRTLTCFRIGDPGGRFPIFDAEGARLYPGRWNKPTSPIIYASEHYSTAMLEKLVHANSLLPPNQHYIRITIPAGIEYEVFQPAALPGWDGADESLCKNYGDTWCRERRSAALLVPSIVARIEHNVLLNPLHPDFAKIDYDLPQPVWWDERLYD